jgi:peptide/nickel transport system ATP-binding protein
VSILTIDGLTVSVGAGPGRVDIVRSVSLALERGKILGLVGESGSGKSMTSLAAIGLLPRPGPRITAGRVMLDRTDVTTLEPWQRVEAGHGAISMIFQEPMTSLNPVRRIGDQIVEAIRVRERMSGRQAEDRARELLELVRIPDAELQLAAFPHQLSGGMRQRVMIAIALAGRPQVLIADEPTTALDVTVQFQILGLLRELCDTLDMAMLFITHDMGVIAQLADRVAVMYAGRIVETASASELFAAPGHPYSRALLACMPIRGVGANRLRTIPGQAPRAGGVKVGCSFAPRCQEAREVCRVEDPPRLELGINHDALCTFPIVDGRPL